MPTRLRWRTSATLASLALLFACLKDKAPTGVDATSARLGLRLAVTTTSGSQLHIQIFYLDQGPTAAGIPAFLLDQTKPIASGTTAFPLTVDLSPCLTDPHRQVGGPQCELFVSVALIQNGITVDSVTLAPVSAVPGQVINVTPTISVSAIGSVVVVPSTDTVGVGGTVQLTDTVRDINGAILPGHAVVWTSADSNTARVDTGGHVTGVKIGTTQVTATAGGQSASANIVVIKGVNIIPSQDTIAFVGNVDATPNSNLVNVFLTSSDTAVVVQGVTAGPISYGPAQRTGWLQASILQNLGQAVKRHRPGITMGSRVASRVSRSLVASSVTTPAYLQLQVSDSLPAGSYTATLQVSGTGVAPTTIFVTYALTDAPLIALNPTTLQFNEYASGSAVAPAQTVTVSNTSVGTLGAIAVAYTSYQGRSSGWLNYAVVGNTISVQPNTTALPLGPDSAWFYVTAANAVNNYQQVTVNISAAVTFAKIVGGNGFACGLTTGGTVYCWGDNSFGQLGNGTVGGASSIPVYVAVPNVASVTAPASDIAAGARHVCVLSSPNKEIYCWGDNARGQIGVAPAGGVVATPTLVAGLAGVAVAAGGAHSCAISTPYVLCWGDNNYGQLGLGVADTVAHTTPTAPGVTATSVTAGLEHTCALKPNTLYCWGSDSAGQVGDDTLGIGRIVSLPRAINVLDVSGAPVTVTSVSAGGAHTCVIDAGNVAHCWGNNQFGQLGTGAAGAPTALPTIVPGLAASAISAGQNHTCAISTASTAFCWGANTVGQLGNSDGSGTSKPSPALITGGTAGVSTAIAASATGDFSCDVKSTGTVCFGAGGFGQLGDNATANTAVPAPVYGQPVGSGVTPSQVKITVRPRGRR